MRLFELILALAFLVLSFGLPALVARGFREVPAVDHLSEDQRRGVRGRFLRHPLLRTVCAATFVLPLGLTILVYWLPNAPGLLTLAMMIGTPFVVAVAAAMAILHPLWRRVVGEELRRLGELRQCPGCLYDLAGIEATRCPECGAAIVP